MYLTHTQLAAYLNFFEIVELLNLKKKTLTTEKHVGHYNGMSLIKDAVACGSAKNRQLEVHG